MPRKPIAATLERQITTLTDRVNELLLSRESSTSAPLAVSIAQAARDVGMSKSQFRRVFLSGGWLRTIPAGDRARVVDVEELRAAYQRYKQQQRATKTLDSDVVAGTP